MPMSTPMTPKVRVIANASPMIVCMIVAGGAPKALRIPNSLVRSRTDTSMILLTPTPPEMSVQSPKMMIKRRIAAIACWFCSALSSWLHIPIASVSSG